METNLLFAITNSCATSTKCPASSGTLQAIGRKFDEAFVVDGEV
jgi:hypothetical protein